MIEKCYVIPVEKACNANCMFCISKSRNYNSGKEFLEIDENLCEKLKVLNRREIKKFEITGGGEPFLNKNLEEITRLIRYYVKDAYIKVYTNGNILKSKLDVDEVDISVVHYIEEVNQKFMRVASPVSLDDKLKFFKRNYPNIKIRLSIPIIKGAIDSSSELSRMISNTERYVDEYVVRTLYEGCPNYNEEYFDFTYEDARVVFERDNSVRDFDGILLWSDGKFYTDWNIDKKRFFDSYLMLKPDAQTYIREIESEIVNSGLVVRERRVFEDFLRDAYKVYESYGKGSEYMKLIRNHLNNLVNLFGNSALLYLFDADMKQEELIVKTLELKRVIRDKYSFTHRYNGYLLKNGEYSHVNLVHCPDSLSEFNNDINILEKSSRILSDAEVRKVLKYRSFNI